MSDPKRELFTAHIPAEVLSRGNGDEVRLNEVTTFDVMPQIIGAAFLTDPELRARVHFDGNHYGPYLATEAAYTRLAEAELAAGGLTQAIDAYRRGLHHAIAWVTGVASFGGPDRNPILLTREDVNRLNVAERFGGLEAQLAEQIWEGEFAFHPDEYAAFVREVRRLEKRRLQLHGLFFFGSSQAFEPLVVDEKHDPEIGREYIDICVAMNRFKEAAWIAQELGLEAEAAELGERVKDAPQDHPRIEDLLRSERARFDY